MKTGTKGIELIKRFEGCVLKAYQCPAMKWTIGYGNTTYEDGALVKNGDTITKERAEQLLLNLLPQYENKVKKHIQKELNQNQFDALISFTWNTGGSDTLFKWVNLAVDENEIYKWWTTHYTTANGKVMAGLITRRESEAKLFIEKL